MNVHTILETRFNTCQYQMNFVVWKKLYQRATFFQENANIAVVVSTTEVNNFG
jgi:hypothetical protein